MKQIISSIFVGFIFSVFVYFLLDGWSIKNVIDSNPNIWENARVRSLEVIGIIGGFSIGMSGMWQIIQNFKEIDQLHSKGIKMRGKSK